MVLPFHMETKKKKKKSDQPIVFFLGIKRGKNFFREDTSHVKVNFTISTD